MRIGRRWELELGQLARSDVFALFRLYTDMVDRYPYGTRSFSAGKLTASFSFFPRLCLVSTSASDDSGSARATDRQVLYADQNEAFHRTFQSRFTSPTW